MTKESLCTISLLFGLSTLACTEVEKSADSPAGTWMLTDWEQDCSEDSTYRFCTESIDWTLVINEDLSGTNKITEMTTVEGLNGDDSPNIIITGEGAIELTSNDIGYILNYTYEGTIGQEGDDRYMLSSDEMDCLVTDGLLECSAYGDSYLFELQ